MKKFFAHMLIVFMASSTFLCAGNGGNGGRGGDSVHGDGGKGGHGGNSRSCPCGERA